MQIQPIILFDGVCNFCDGAVNFVIKRDKKNKLKFAPLQTAAAKQLMVDYNLPDTMESFILIVNGQAYSKSTAALKVCRYLTGLWPICYGLIVVPKVIRDGVYNWIAKNRYKWFGQKDTCMMPTPAIREKFLN